MGGAGYAQSQSMSGRGEKDNKGKIKTSKLGKALITVTITETGLHVFPQLYSYVDEAWRNPYYDSQSRMLLHADDWLLSQENIENHRFLMLTPIRTSLTIDTERIRRIQYALQTI